MNYHGNQGCGAQKSWISHILCSLVISCAIWLLLHVYYVWSLWWTSSLLNGIWTKPNHLSNSKCILGIRSGRDIIPLPYLETMHVTSWNGTVHIRLIPDAAGRPASAHTHSWIQNTTVNTVLCPTAYTVRENTGALKAPFQVRAYTIHCAVLSRSVISKFLWPHLL